jgi:hypothetical protein
LLRRDHENMPRVCRPAACAHVLAGTCAAPGRSRGGSTVAWRDWRSPDGGA